MTNVPGIEEVLHALRRVSYPGYSANIVELGVVEAVEAAPDGSVTVMLRQATEYDDVMRRVAGEAYHALTAHLGIARPELKVRRVEPELGEKTGKVRLEGTRFVVAVASGKGGVGKSTVAANLAVALGKMGMKTGLLDADIYGPSVPMMFGAMDERPRSAGESSFYPIEKYGVKMISIGFFLADKAPVIWRGPMVMSAVRQFLKDTLWGTQDVLVVDLPPGTGDAQLTLAQQVALDGVVIVTTPQDVALLDAMRAVKMFRQVHCPMLGVVENMSYFECPDCGEREELFGAGGAEKMARGERMPLLGKIPLYPALREAGDSGMPLVLAHPEHPASLAFLDIAEQIAHQLTG